MASIKVKLVRSVSGRPGDQKQTVLGLGLKKFGQQRVLNDSPQIRGMVAKVGHLLQVEKSTEAAPKGARRSAPKAAAK